VRKLDDDERQSTSFERLRNFQSNSKYSTHVDRHKEVLRIYRSVIENVKIRNFESVYYNLVVWFDDESLKKSKNMQFDLGLFL